MKAIGKSVRSIIILTVTLTPLALVGCSTTQCQKFQSAYGAAQAGYAQAVASGANTTQMDKWRWTLDALKASVTFWCSTEVGAKAPAPTIPGTTASSASAMPTE